MYVHMLFINVGPIVIVGAVDVNIISNMSATITISWQV